MGNSVVLERLPTASGYHPSTSSSVHLRKRIYIFLTRYGLIFAVNLMVMLIGAVNYNNSLAYSLTFLLSGLFMVAMLHTYANLRGLIISANSAEPVFAGQQATFPLLFDNRLGKLRPAIDIQSWPLLKRRLRKKTAKTEIFSVNIPARTLLPFDLTVPAPTRGYLLPDRLIIKSTWPLGLFRAWAYLQIEQACVVYPEPLGTRTLPSMTIVDEEELSGKGIGNEDFIGFRQYQSGDSMRAIDWKAYARERGLIIKRFSGKGSKKIIIDWKRTSDMAGTEKRLSQLCLWIIEAEKQQTQYALSLPGFSHLEFSNGEQHKHKCLQALAKYD